MSAHGVRYRLALTLDTVRYYGRHRRWVPMIRATWLVLIRGHFGEVCERCGRRYLLWHSDDDLYARIIGSSEPGKSGLFCPSCFTSQARAAGLRLIWVPAIFRGLDDALIIVAVHASMVSDQNWTR